MTPTLPLAKRIQYAIRNLVAPMVCRSIGHRVEVVEVGAQKFTICTRCGEN